MLVLRQTSCRAPIRSLTTAYHLRPIPCTLPSSRHYTDAKPTSPALESSEPNAKPKPVEDDKAKKKTQAELDHELQLKLQGLAGDGGEAGIEYEDGKPVAMKRSVRNNMFRYI